MVERFFRDLTDKRLLRGVFCDVEPSLRPPWYGCNRILVGFPRQEENCMRWERG